MLTVACLYKTGGEFRLEDVRKLAHQVSLHLPVEHRFVCFSDDIFNLPGVERWPLRPGLPHWWGKMQFFALSGPVLTLDLDTVIVDSLARLAQTVENLGERVLMLEDFYKKGVPASGLMGWAGSMAFVWDKFVRLLESGHRFQTTPHAVRLILHGRTYRGDQDLLAELLKGREIVFAQKAAPGICSYKVHVRPTGAAPKGTAVICFHGQPRPSAVAGCWRVER